MGEEIHTAVDDARPPSRGSLPFRLRLRRIVRKIGLNEETFLVLVSILIGAATGLFAHLFFGLIEVARKFAFGAGPHAGLFSGQPWMLVVLPTVGAFAVGVITHYFAREAKGHGVPEVMDALYRCGGEIRPRVASAKAVASALTIGSGGSAGTEGPIIQIGAAIGSSLGHYLHIPRRQMNVVVGCGVSAGIAAIFNAPIAGVLFALEIFLRDFSFRTFSPIVFSSVISCSVMHALRLNDVAIFEVRALREMGYEFAGAELPLHLVLGILCAFAAVMFIRLLYFIEDRADSAKISEVFKPALGGMALGLTGMVYALATRSNEMPAFYGNGYPAIQAILSHGLLQMTVAGLVMLFLLKLVATSLTLGSGGSGGVFAPSLLLGASLGGAYGLALGQTGIVHVSSANAYALVGAAAVVAGTTHAPLTAIVMLYEITREPRVILPAMFAAVIATAGSRFLLPDSIYTLKLRRRGVRIGTITDLTILRRITVEDVKRAKANCVYPGDPLQKLLDLAGVSDAVDFVVVDEQGAYQGMVIGRDIRTALLQPEAVSLLVVDELVRSEVPTVSRRETLDIVLDKFALSDVESLPVAKENDDAQIEGLITRHAVIQRYQRELDRQTR